MPLEKENNTCFRGKHKTCTQHSSWKPASGTLRAVCGTLCVKWLWLCLLSGIPSISTCSVRATRRLAKRPGYLCPAACYWEILPFWRFGRGWEESLLFAALVGDLGKAVLEWKEHPAQPCLVRKHESKSRVNPGLDCDAAFVITCDLLHRAPHQTACSANSSCILLSCCLHVYLKELLWSLFKSTSNGKWRQMVLRAVLQIPKAWMYRKPFSCRNSTGRTEESQPCQPFLCVSSPTLLCLSPSCLGQIPTGCLRRLWPSEAVVPIWSAIWKDVVAVWHVYVFLFPCCVFVRGII